LTVATVKRVAVGDAVLSNQQFSVAPVRAGFGVSAGQPVDGLIGFEVLARFVTTFDYGKRRAVLRLPGRERLSHAFPFVLNGRIPQFGCRINREATQCTLDTGSRES